MRVQAVAAAAAVAAAHRVTRHLQRDGFEDFFGAGLQWLALFVLSDAMKKCFATIAALLAATQAHAQVDPNSARAYYPSCLVAADIVQGKRPAADSEDAAKQLRQAALCFGAVAAVANLEPFFKPEFALCPPADGKISPAQMVTAVVAHLKSHPELLNNNFHQLAATVLAAAWPCPK